jgi:hypothetical protein
MPRASPNTDQSTSTLVTLLTLRAGYCTVQRVLRRVRVLLQLVTPS